MKLHRSLPLVPAAVLALTLVPATHASPETGAVCVSVRCASEFAAIAVTAGGHHTCVLLSTGNVDCYGNNNDGQAAEFVVFPAVVGA